MRADIPTLLSIAEFGQILGINPWELAQIGSGFTIPNPAQCDFVFFQHPWQRTFLCREEIARAISQAEMQVAQYLGFWPAPKYFYDEITKFPYRVGSIYTLDRTPDYALKWGKLIKTGIQTRALVQANAPLVLSDRDGDTITDTFTMTIATTVVDPDEIHIYYSLADRFSEAVASQWEIRPINVTITGGVATIKGHSSLLVKPILEETTNPQILDVTAAIYVTTADVYREYTDITVNTTVMNQGWFAYDDTTIAPVPVYVTAYDQDQGIARWSLYTDNCYGDIIPERIHTNYVSGIPRENNRMAYEFADIVAHLAVIYLAGRSCGCERTDQILNYWSDLPSSQSDRRPLTIKEIDSPFGPQRGAYYAWSKISNLMLVKGTSVE
jgi:hypothetical protein